METLERDSFASLATATTEAKAGACLDESVRTGLVDGIFQVCAVVTAFSTQRPHHHHTQSCICLTVPICLRAQSDSQSKQLYLFPYTGLVWGPRRRTRPSCSILSIIVSSMAESSHLTVASTTSEDWDRSLSEEPDSRNGNRPNTVSFPGSEEEESTTPVAGGKGKRTLSELLKLHAEKGTDVNFTQEEATRLAEVLGQWVGA